MSVFQNDVRNLSHNMMDNMVQKFMYYRIYPEYAGTEYETISLQMVVGRIHTFDRIYYNPNILYRRIVFGCTHIQTGLNQSQLCFILHVQLCCPPVFPFQITAKEIAGKNLGNCHRKILYPIPKLLTPFIVGNIAGRHNTATENLIIPKP